MFKTGSLAGGKGVSETETETTTATLFVVVGEQLSAANKNADAIIISGNFLENIIENIENCYINPKC